MGGGLTFLGFWSPPPFSKPAMVGRVSHAGIFLVLCSQKRFSTVMDSRVYIRPVWVIQKKSPHLKDLTLEDLPLFKELFVWPLLPPFDHSGVLTRGCTDTPSVYLQLESNKEFYEAFKKLHCCRLSGLFSSRATYSCSFLHPNQWWRL